MATKNEQRKIEIIADGKKAGASIKEMRAAVSLLNNQLDKLPQGTKEFVEKSKELKQVKQRLSEVQKEAKSIEPAMDAGTRGMGLMAKGTNLLKFAFQAAVTALLPLFAFQKLIELGRHFFSVSDQVNKLKGSIQSLTSATGAELNELTVQVQAVSNTFGKDYNEVLKAGNVLAQQMGISHQEAFSLIEKGLLAGVDLNGDFLEQVSEYAPQFKQAGVEAEDFVSHLVRAEKEGIFSDKGADVVKEFGLRIREQTKATKDALEGAFGQQFTKELFDGLNDGSITTVEALRRVSKQMNESGASASQLQTIVADVFGGPGEDAGLEYLKSLQDIGGELDSMIDVTNAVTQRKLDQLAVEKELAAAQVELGAELGPVSTGFSNFFTILQTVGTQVLVSYLRYLQSLKFGAIGVVEAIKQLASNVGALFSAIASGDFSQIKEAFTNLGSGVAGSYNQAYSEAEAIYHAERLEAKKQQAEQEKQIAGQAAQQQAEAQKVQQQQEAQRLKEHAQKLAEERKKAKEAELKAERAIQDLRIALIEDDTQRELATLQLRHERALEQLVGNEQQKEEQKRLLQEQFRIEREELEAARQEADEEKRLADLEKSFEQMDEEEELKKAKLEEHYLNAMLTEQQRDQAQLDLHKSMLEAKLALLEQAGQGETLQAQKLKNAILAINKEKNDKIKADEEKLKADKAAIQQASFDAAMNFMSLHSGIIQQDTDERVAALDKRIEILKTDEEYEGQNLARIGQLEREKEQIRKESARKIARIKIAQIITDGIAEVAAIWKNYNSSPANILLPGFGAAMAAIQTGLAIGRTALAIRKVKSQTFADGGFTGSGLFVDGKGKLRDQTGFAIAGVAHEDEWYAPKWMVESPKYANVIGWLESERTRRFAEGGFTDTGNRRPETGMPPVSGFPDSVSVEFQMLRRDFQNYAARVDRWATMLKVNNDPRDIRDGLNVLNRIDEDSDIR